MTLMEGLRSLVLSQACKRWTEAVHGMLLQRSVKKAQQKSAVGGGTMITDSGNPYEAVDLTRPRSRDDGRSFKRFVVAIFSFFIAFWAGAITLLVCVVLREKGIL